MSDKYFVIGFRRYKTLEEFKNKILGHNERNRHYSKSHKNINWERTKDNIVLKSCDFKNLNELKEYAKERLAKGKRSLKRGAAWGFEIVVDCSPMENWGEEDYIRYLKDAEEFFRKRFDGLLLLNSVIHLDENKPHLHLSFSYFNEKEGMWYQRKLKEKQLDRLPLILKDFQEQVGKKYGLIKGNGRKLKRIEEDILRGTKLLKVEKRKFLFFKEVKKYKILSPNKVKQKIREYKELLEIADIKELKEKNTELRKENEKLKQEKEKLEKELKDIKQRFLDITFKTREMEKELKRMRQINNKLIDQIATIQAQKVKSTDFTKAKNVIKDKITNELKR